MISNASIGVNERAKLFEIRKFCTESNANIQR